MRHGAVTALLLAVTACSGPEPASASPPAEPAPVAAQPAAPEAVLPSATGSETAVAELQAWVDAVESGDIDRMVARVREPVTFRAKHMLERPAQESLDRDGLRAALVADQSRLLGLHKNHLLPRPQDLVSKGADRAVAVDPRCPSVTWTFEKRGGRWFLDEVAVELLEC